MLNTFLSAAIAFCAIANATDPAVEVKLMTKDDKPEDLLPNYEFSVISFFRPSDPDSVEIDSIFDDAVKYFNDQIKK